MVAPPPGGAACRSNRAPREQRSTGRGGAPDHWPGSPSSRGRPARAGGVFAAPPRHRSPSPLPCRAHRLDPGSGRGSHPGDSGRGGAGADVRDNGTLPTLARPRPAFLGLGGRAGSGGGGASGRRTPGLGQAASQSPRAEPGPGCQCPTPPPAPSRDGPPGGPGSTPNPTLPPALPTWRPGEGSGGFQPPPFLN